MNIKRNDLMHGSNMPVKVAVDEAMIWWEKHGRDLMRFKRESAESKSKEAFNVTNPNDKNFVASGIIAGKPWADLTKDEQLSIVKKWHSEFIGNGPRKS